MSSPAPSEALSAVWPTVARGGPLYQDPFAAARGFATALVGFRDPIVGPFHVDGEQSGEVDVRPRVGGPVTEVKVRRFADRGWWVLAASTKNVKLTAPSSADPLTSPVTLSGRALAFEGTVDVRIVDDSASAPLATGFVTGGGLMARRFSGTFAFDRPTTKRGAIILTTENAGDGQVWTASVSRVAFR